MKRFLSLVLAVTMIILLKTQHCRSISEADSWDVATNSEIYRTTSYDCNGSIHDCITPQADFVIAIDHTFRRILAGARNIAGTGRTDKKDAVCPMVMSGRYHCKPSANGKPPKNCRYPFDRTCPL